MNLYSGLALGKSYIMPYFLILIYNLLVTGINILTKVVLRRYYSIVLLLQ